MCYYSIFILHICIQSTCSQLFYLQGPKIHTSESHIVHYMTKVIISCSTLNKPEQLNIIYTVPNGLNEIKKKEEETTSLFQEISCCKSNFFTVAHLTFDYSSKDLQPLMSHLPTAHYCSLPKIQMEWAAHCR